MSTYVQEVLSNQISDEINVRGHWITGFIVQAPLVLWDSLIPTKDG